MAVFLRFEFGKLIFGILRYVNLGGLRKSGLRLVNTINANLHGLCSG